MYQYREIFYKRYFSSQVGKSDPSSFQKIFDEQKWHFGKEIVPLFGPDTNLKYLDIGCGNGSLIAAAKEKGYVMGMGIDLSEEQVEIANKLGVSEVRKADLKDLIKEGKPEFDLITGMDIIEHFSKDELTELVLDLRKILKPKGRLIFRTPNMDAPFTTVFAYGDFTHECLLNKSSALQLFNSCGYNKVKVDASMLTLKDPLKEMLRKTLWFFILWQIKIQLFASARTWHEVVFTPNLIIRAEL
ncbi:MAG: class I SAM-dependent methyltransferase [Flavobacteriales bacterium]|nr:class I SAM-dependent methyltransferase [Flavobacteriales bacterium]